jgi:hypothetical protein
MLAFLKITVMRVVIVTLLGHDPHPLSPRRIPDPSRALGLSGLTRRIGNAALATLRRACASHVPGLITRSSLTVASDLARTFSSGHRLVDTTETTYREERTVQDTKTDTASNGTPDASESERAWLEVMVKDFRARRPSATSDEVDTLTTALAPWRDLAATPAIMLAITQVAKAEVVDRDGVHDALERASATIKRGQGEPSHLHVVPVPRGPKCPADQSADRHELPVLSAVDLTRVPWMKPTAVALDLRQLIVWFDTFRFTSTGTFPDWGEAETFRDVMGAYVDSLPMAALAGAARGCAEATYVTPGVVHHEVARFYAEHVAHENDGLPPF